MHVCSHICVSLFPKVSCTPLFEGHIVTQVRVRSSAKVPLGQIGTHILVAKFPYKLAVAGQVLTHM